MTIATVLFALIAPPTAGGGAGELTLLDFHADWCGPCRQMRPAVAQLTQEGYPVKSIDIDHAPKTAARYQVKAVPTFIVVDADGKALARSSGAQPARQLAALYNSAKAKLASKAKARLVSDRDDQDDAETEEQGDEPAQPREAEPEPTTTNPKPWETVVRIKISGQGMMGIGSGTIIYSSNREAIILTCAHIFKLDSGRPVPPSRFPNKITIDLFDGKLHGQQPAQVHYANESYDGEAIDYDFGLDVGLIRIRPNRKLPAARVVPTSWQPLARMAMITVGCPKGHDATAWSTAIINPSMKGLSGNGGYEAIECTHAPKQGRSGGGLFTSDGYVAGVCDFAEPRGDHGLYASPNSVHHLLDRNRLTALYAPVTNRPGTQLAGAAAKRDKAPAIARAQSPDRDDPDDLTVPPPEMLGIKTPKVARLDDAAPRAKGRKTPWHAAPPPVSRASEEFEEAETVDLKLDPRADNDHFRVNTPEPRPSSEGPESDESEAPVKPRRPGKWRPVRTTAEER